MIAAGFWVSFAVGRRRARRDRSLDHGTLAPRPDLGWSFWWLLVSSPEILVFLFFMITDPKTAPPDAGRAIAYARRRGSRGHAPGRTAATEFATKVAVLGALTLVCIARPLLGRSLPLRARAPAPIEQDPRRGLGARGCGGVRPRPCRGGPAGALGEPPRGSDDGDRRRRRPGRDRGDRRPVQGRRIIDAPPARAPHCAGRRHGIERGSRCASHPRSGASRGGGRRRPAGPSCSVRLAEHGQDTPSPLRPTASSRCGWRSPQGPDQLGPRILATVRGTVAQATYAGSPPRLEGRTRAVDVVDGVRARGDEDRLSDHRLSESAGAVAPARPPCLAPPRSSSSRSEPLDRCRKGRPSRCAPSSGTQMRRASRSPWR